MHMKYLVNMTCTFPLAAILLKILKWTQSGATYSQEIIEMVYVEKKI